MKFRVKKEFLFTLLIFLLFSTLYAQDSSFGQNGTIYFGYNEKPDSVTINGKKMELSSKGTIIIAPGTYTIEAYLACYYTIRKEINLKPNRVKSVRLKFKHLTTKEFRTYKINNGVNYAFSALGVGLSPLYSAGVKSLLPISFVGLTGHLLWRSNQQKLFDNCTGDYRSPKYKNSSLKLFVGLNSFVTPQFSNEVIEDFYQVYNTPAPIAVQRRLKKRVTIAPNDNFSSKYSLLFGMEKKVIGRLNISGKVNIYPSMTAKIDYYDEAPQTTNFEELTPAISEEISSMFMLYEYDLGVEFYRGLNSVWEITLGGFMSNTLVAEKEYGVTAVQVTYFTENPVFTPVKYSYKASGAAIGLDADYRFGDRWSFKMNYKLFFQQTLELNGTEENLLFSNISSNLVYNL